MAIRRRVSMRKINRLSPQDVTKKNEPGRYADGGGLYLQVVSREGEDGKEQITRSWLFRYMLNGQARHMGLGSVKTFSLQEARLRARAQRQMLADGVDPLGVRRGAEEAAKLDAARRITFRDAAERYIAAHKAGWKNPKHGTQWENTLATYAHPVIGNLPVASIDTGLVLKVLEPIWTEKTETASRVRNRIELVLDWARARGARTGENPARWRGHLDKLLAPRAKVAPVKHQPAMDWREVPAFMGELRANASVSARLLEFIILTTVRTGEAIGARWDEIDLDEKLWTIPGERMKAGKEHRVPLCDRAVAILKRVTARAATRSCSPACAPANRSPTWPRSKCCGACDRASPCMASGRRSATGRPRRPTSRASSPRPRSRTRFGEPRAIISAATSSRSVGA
jgi:integrase